MKTIKKLYPLFVTVILSASVVAQTPKPRVSPPVSVSGKIGEAAITINYSSPSVKGRAIWGKLVPYDSVWRAGANEATTFETNRNLKIAGKLLPYGKYGFFLVPKAKGKWVAVFNKVSSQWGAFKYDQTQDQLRVKVKANSLVDKQETLSYEIKSDGFNLNWELRSVFIPVTTTP